MSSESKLDRTTIISDDQLYRYTLWREFDLTNYGKVAMFLCLNPSVADAQIDDPTVRRCIDFAKRFGCGALAVVNLFAYRSTDPILMKSVSDPIGPENDYWLRTIASQADIVIAAWGVHGKHLGRDAEVSAFLPQLHCLGTTKDGSPRHPLYVRADTKLEPFSIAA